MTTFISRQSWKRKRKTSLIDAVEFYLAPGSYDTQTHSAEMFLQSWALWLTEMGAKFSFQLSIFHLFSLGLPLWTFISCFCCFIWTGKMFSLAFVDNMEIVSVMAYQGDVTRIVSLQASYCWQGWIQSHKISSGTDVRSLRGFRSVDDIIWCASSTGEGWHWGEITAFNQNYKSATACSCYRPSHLEPYLFGKAPSD